MSVKLASQIKVSPDRKLGWRDFLHFMGDFPTPFLQLSLVSKHINFECPVWSNYRWCNREKLLSIITCRQYAPLYHCQRRQWESHLKKDKNLKLYVFFLNKKHYCKMKSLNFLQSDGWTADCRIRMCVRTSYSSQI